MPSIRRAWPWMLALALVRALALALSVPDHRALTGDEPIYEGVARSLLSCHGFGYHGGPWVAKPPGWILVLALTHVVAGDHVRAGVLVQGLFDTGSILLAAWMARRIFRSAAAGWIAFALMLVWPPFLRESRFLQTDPMFTFTVMLLAAAFLRFMEAPGFGRAAWTGLAAGLAAFVRPNGIMLLVGLLGSAFLVDRRARSLAFVPRAATMVIACFLVLAPWTLRNARVFHAFIPVSLGAGEFFYMGSTPETDGRWDHAQWDGLRGRVIDAEARRLGRTPNAVEQDRALFAAGLDAWRHDPALQFGIWIRRVGRLIAVPLGPERSMLRIGFLLAILLLDGLAIWGTLSAAGEGGTAGRIAAAILLTVLFNAMVQSSFLTASRYFEPLRALLIVLASGGMMRILPGRATEIAR